MRLTRLRAVTGAVAAITLLVGVSASAHTSAPPALKNGGTLTIALDADPDALDPTLARTFVGRMVFLDMCEKLYDLNAKLQIVPQLAASLPTFSADKKTVTIKLRKGIKFNDGTTFDAAAVKKSLDRHKTLKASARASELAPVSSIDTSGNSTVILHLTDRYSPITAQLADRAGMIMSPKQLDALGDKFATNPVCVGPFMFKDRSAGDHITLTKSPYYYGKKNVHLDTIVWKIITDPAARAANLRSHDVDVSEGIPSTDSSRSPQRLLAEPVQVDVDRLPGDHRQHRQLERARETAVYEHRHRDREVGRPTGRVRARARPEGDQQGRLRRHDQPRLLPCCARHAVLCRDEGDPVQADGRCRCCEGRVQAFRGGVRRHRAPDARHRPGCRTARPGDPGHGEADRHQRRPRPDRVRHVAEPRGRRQVRDLRDRLVGPHRRGRQHVRLPPHDRLAKRQRLLERRRRPCADERTEGGVAPSEARLVPRGARPGGEGPCR